jgi:hypothetical protein
MTERHNVVVFRMGKKLELTSTWLFASSVTDIFAELSNGESVLNPMIPAPQEIPIPLL